MRRAAAAAAVLLALAACGHEEKNLSGVEKVAPPAGAAPMPAAPAGNPHAANPHAGMTPAPQGPAATPVAWNAPATWKSSPPASTMRVAQFDVGTDEKGDTVQCNVFGGIGGTDEQNIAIWVGQMGAAAKDSAVVGHADHDGLKITRLEVRGAYTDSMRPGEPKVIPAATMLAAIVETPGGGKLHVKLVGSTRVVDAAAGNFDVFLASMKPK